MSDEICLDDLRRERNALRTIAKNISEKISLGYEEYVFNHPLTFPAYCRVVERDLGGDMVAIKRGYRDAKDDSFTWSNFMSTEGFRNLSPKIELDWKVFSAKGNSLVKRVEVLNQKIAMLSRKELVDTYGEYDL